MTTASSGSFARQDREGRAEHLAAGRGPTATLVGRVVGIGGGRQGGAEDAERPGTIDEALRPDVLGPRHRVWNEAVVSQLPDRDEVVVVCVADEGGGPGEILVEVGGVTGESRDRIEEGQVHGVPLGGERVGRWPRPVRRPAIRDGSESMSAAPAAETGDGRRAGRIRGPGLRCREELLQVAQAVATVAARVDPVVTQSTGVAPGPDRVRMHPQQAGSLGDGQGRIDRS